MTLRGVVEKTFLRGILIYHNSEDLEPITRSIGKLL